MMYTINTILDTLKALQLTVISAIVEELLLIEVNDVCTNVVQERLVVGHDEEGLLPSLKVTKRGGRYKRQVQIDGGC